ncbi:hypothetical protein B0T14DRAFT_522536 [Immersiella caudata]|uniref:Uncharacterized protein n=1 Tax=Immersiella caudata TaxID=314043 RepID=A0AA40C104_9PEZI|nr:hypothetical protein B0T14DRAFT_522536 [Immersiella caudata]
MLARFDCMSLAAIAQYKLSAQTGRPALPLRLLVGHSNLLNSLVQELVDTGAWASLEAPPLSKPVVQSDSSAQSKFAENFDEHCEDGNSDWGSSDSDDDDSTSSSEWSDEGWEDDNCQQQRMAETDNGVRRLSLLEDHLCQLCFLASQTVAGGSSNWSMEDLGGRDIDDEPSVQAPVVVSSEKEIAEMSRLTPSPTSHPGLFRPPLRNPVRLAKPARFVPARASIDLKQQQEQQQAGAHSVLVTS